ncbi:hypothetical protein B0J11DRAFT_597822 [Dendryphion nanum]|uniref:Amidohydrolase-related domain-containing protein n=1 Tax=Dendryphion nanum TaxID=256645 RepID=A0A9P9IAF6_9PLEO|nr:hypothetical protein B0J11DRAFT_597822 [Dendryphion nanum]
MGKILDTHIHLWPGTSVSPTHHAWMTPGHFLSKRHGISDYLSVARATSAPDAQPAGFIYVETDRYLPSTSPNPSIFADDSESSKIEKLKEWAKEPLEELRFLRRIVEGNPDDEDGFLPQDSNKMVGCVIWAPFHLSTSLFNLYLRIAGEIAGTQLWNKVVGFRYLVQGIRTEGEMRQVVENHLCKPDLSSPSSTSTSTPHPTPLYTSHLTHLSTDPYTTIKLSGALNEFAPSPTPSSIPALVTALTPFTDLVFDLFGPERVMFGSDWPVCDVGGPLGEKNWGLWRGVVEEVLAKRGLGEKEKEKVWWGVGETVYGVDA